MTRKYFKSKENVTKEKIKSKSRSAALIREERKYLNKLLAPQIKQISENDIRIKLAIMKAECDLLLKNYKFTENDILRLTYGDD